MASRQLVVHGALDHAELAAQGIRPENVLDFSSNLNPFGPPAGVRAALSALDPAPYPDRSCFQLRRALAAQHCCGEEQILPGNGSNELIYLLARALLRPGDNALVVGPTFGEYAQASRMAGARVSEWRAAAEQQFIVDGNGVAQEIERLHPRLTWLCAPNNPSGADVAAAHIAALADVCASNGGRLVVDRAYLALRRDARPPYVEPATLSPALIRLYSLTKSHALAGVRLGYLLAAVELVQEVAALQPAWSVSSAAQAAGLAALADRQFLQQSIPQLWQASDRLVAGLGRLGLEVRRGSLPFLLARTGDGAATRSELLRRGCVVRDCASFGLPEWVRVSPRRPKDNDRLLTAWRSML